MKGTVMFSRGAVLDPGEEGMQQQGEAVWSAAVRDCCNAVRTEGVR
jgi:hypothetical protein